MQIVRDSLAMDSKGTPEGLGALTVRWLDRGYNHGDFDGLESIFKPKIRGILNGMSFCVTFQELKNMTAAWRAAFPDIQCAFLAQLVDQNRVFDYTFFTGTHTGASFGGIPPSGRPFRFHQMTLATFEDGCLARIDEVFDFRTFERQLGGRVNFAVEWTQSQS